SNFVQKAGLEQTGYIKKIDTLELFNELEHIWTSLGKQPTTTDMKKGISKYSLDTFTRRFGGWRNTLKAFIDYINDENEEYHEEETEKEENQVDFLPRNNEQTNEDDIKIKIKRTPRNINLRLRFKVLARDNFTCCYCGASPAKDPNVELHVDHILPWSEGGETIIENLQTSCSNCNLGKGNMKHT
ncbi:MAG: HNH endonuclease, partial [Candidatus Lokiarchaeota archaeon]|nr:HNH endonuclease [Candidatus Lokiarchaeota archaeon]